MSNPPYPPNPQQPQRYEPTSPLPAQPVAQPGPVNPGQAWSAPAGTPPATPGGPGGNRLALIIVGTVVATAVAVTGLILAVQALGHDDATTAAKPTPSVGLPVVPSAPASAPPSSSAVVAATPSATAATFPPGYVVHDGDQFGIQKPSGWAVKADANSRFFRDAPIVELAQNNVAYWSNPTTYPTENGFSVTDLTATANNPADFINALAPSTTQRPVCANYTSYAVAFTRGDWVGQRLDSGVCSDTGGRAVLIAATRRSDGAKLGLLIRGPEPIGATESQAMNAFDTYRR